MALAAVDGMRCVTATAAAAGLIALSIAIPRVASAEPDCTAKIACDQSTGFAGWLEFVKQTKAGAKALLNADRADFYESDDLQAALTCRAVNHAMTAKQKGRDYAKEPLRYAG